MKGLITGPKFNKYSLLASFLYLIKDIKSETKAKELLLEIKNTLMNKINNDFYKKYLNIEEDLEELIIFKYQITIDQNNITNSTLYLNDYDKTYYLFSKTIRVNFNKNANLFQYSDFMIYDYIKNRINYLYKLNSIFELTEEIKEEIDNTKCQLVKKYIEDNQYNKDYFFINLFNDIDNNNLEIPPTLISKILQTNIIILDKNTKLKKLIENDKNYKYILLFEKNKKYIPLHTKDKKIFYDGDEILSQIKEKEEEKDKRLEKIMTKKEDFNNVKDYVFNLGLDEA